MAVRDFDGVDDHIDLSLGSLLSVITAFTFVAVYKSDLDHAGGLLCAMRDSDTVAAYGMNPFSDGNLYVNANGFSGAAYPDGAWIMAAWGKPAGTAISRFHLYNYNTQAAPTHADGSSIGDPTVTPDRIKVGQWRNNAEFFNGKLAALAVYESALSDIAFEGIIDGIQAMLDAVPSGLWSFNQDSIADSVLDLMENGANQISIVGTSVITSDDPPGFDFGGNVDPILVGTGSIIDQIMAGLISQGFTTGSVSNRERARLLSKLVLTEPQSKSLEDLYGLASESNRLYGIGV